MELGTLVETSLLILGLVSTIAIPRILLLSCKTTMPLGLWDVSDKKMQNNLVD